MAHFVILHSKIAPDFGPGLDIPKVRGYNRNWKGRCGKRLVRKINEA